MGNRNTFIALYNLVVIEKHLYKLLSTGRECYSIDYGECSAALYYTG
jgi:hypothetical protein